MYNSRINRRGNAAPVDTVPGPGVSMEATEGEHGIYLGDLLRVIRNRLWVIVLVAVILTGGAVAFSLAQTPTYEASIQILVGQERGAADAPRDDVLSLQKLTQTMAETINSRRVAEVVISQQGLQTTAGDFLEDLRV